MVGSKVWHSTSKYRRTIYQCNRKFKGEEKCGTPHVTEEAIKTAFVSAVNKILAIKDATLTDFNANKTMLFDTASFEKERGELLNEITVVTGLIQKCIEENARTALDQNEYDTRYAALTERYNTAKKQLDDVESNIVERNSRRVMMEKFLADIAAIEGSLIDFDESVWTALIDYATVGKDGTIAFTFKNGDEVKS